MYSNSVLAVLNCRHALTRMPVGHHPSAGSSGSNLNVNRDYRTPRGANRSGLTGSGSRGSAGVGVGAGLAQSRSQSELVSLVPFFHYRSFAGGR